MRPTNLHIVPAAGPSADRKSAVVCENVDKHYLVMDKGDAWRLLFSRQPKGSKSFRALNDVSLTVPKGEFVGLLGRNGAGKSTLLRTIGGVFTPTAGFVDISGGVSGLYGLGIGGHDMLTGREFVQRWLDLSGEPRATIKEKAEEIKEFTELGDFFERPLRTYSTGMGARLFFATITAVNADVFVIDEVLVVGDEYFSAKCWRRMRERLANGASGVFATHDWAAMLKICSSAYVLEGGHVVDSGKAADVARRYIELDDPTPSIASFAPDLADVVCASHGEELRFSVPIDVMTDEPLCFSMSVEAFKPYYGWQHLLHLNAVPLVKGEGRQTVEVRIDQLPLSAGRYLLNLFVTYNAKTSGGERETLDVRSWLYGNAIQLDVDGHASSALAQLPFSWRVSKQP